MALISLKHVSVGYREQLILNNISVVFPEASLMAIIGPNGVGKSTLLKVITGEIVPIAGSIHISSSASLSYVPQRAMIDWNFPITVRDVVVMGTYGELRWFERPTKEHWKRVDEVLERVGLQAYGHRLIKELSGGQQQRMFLARALVQHASVMLLDEPFAAIDSPSEQIIMDLLKQYVKQGNAVIMVHHDLTALTHFDWVLSLQKNYYWSGAPHELSTYFLPHDLAL